MRLRAVIAMMVLVCGLGVAQDFGVPNSFSSGEVISASEMNTNFTAIADELNSLKSLISSLLPFDVYVYEIGPWNIDLTEQLSVPVPTGVDVLPDTIAGMDAMIISDDRVRVDSIKFANSNANGYVRFMNDAGGDYFLLVRSASFDSAYYDDTTQNRGFVYVYVLKQ